MSKSYRFTPDYILWNLSFANAGLYNAVLPSYDTDESKEQEKQVDFEDLESEFPD